MAYVDPSEIRGSFREAQALSDALITEFMGQEEAYVSSRLRIPSLPPSDPILTQIIRDLTIARAIFNITPASSERYQMAIAMRQEALRRLDEAESNGWITDPGSTPDARIDEEVYNPYAEEEPFFSPEDYLP